MSARELRALQQDSLKIVSTRLRSQVKEMSYQEENPEDEKLTYLKDKELLGEKLQCAEQTIQEQSFKIEELEKNIETIRMELELDKYKALDALRREHELKLAEEKIEIRKEKERSNSWIKGLTDSAERERLQYEDRMKYLTAELEEAKVLSRHHKPLVSTEYRGSCSESESEDSFDDKNDRSKVSSRGGHESDIRDRVLPSAGGRAVPFLLPDAPLIVKEPAPDIRDGVLPSAGGRAVPFLLPDAPLRVKEPAPVFCGATDEVADGTTSTIKHSALPKPSSQIEKEGHSPVAVHSRAEPTTCDVRAEPETIPQVEPTTTCAEIQPSKQGTNPLLIQSMSKLLQAQTEMLSAQAQAVAVQGLPALSKFSGENLETEEESFDRWLEMFEERAHLAGWTEEHKLYQLKIHLEHTALQIFRMLSDEEKKVYTTVKAKLKKRFRPVDIEELKSIEFHQKMQGTESVEKLGLSLQKLARKAFPSTTGKEFDRLLKGRFFQALHTKWQRKLGAPKPGELFSELYDRARTSDRLLLVGARWRGTLVTTRLV